MHATQLMSRRGLFDSHTQFLHDLQPLLLVLLAGHPEAVPVLHDVGQHGPAQEHHVLAARRVLDTDLKFLRGREMMGEI